MTTLLVVALGMAGAGLLVRAILRIRREERERVRAAELEEARARAAELHWKQLGDAYRAAAGVDETPTGVKCRGCLRPLGECRCPKVLINREGSA